jgi:hypothetical protein
MPTEMAMMAGIKANVYALFVYQDDPNKNVMISPTK